MPTFHNTAMDGYLCDEHGFLYKRYAGGVLKPLVPKRHPLASHTGDFKFYVTIEGKKYSVSQENLKKANINAVWRME